MDVSVIGAGSWGTAVAALLGGKGYDVLLWAREPEIATSVNTEHRNPFYLTDVVFPDSVMATSDAEHSVVGADAVVVVTPSFAIRQTAEMLKPHLGADTPVIVLSKGVEKDTGMLMTDVLAEVLGNPERLAALSGPNHAEEVGKGIPSATVIASTSDEVARFFQELFTAPTFRVYTSTDLVGVELCAAAKNIVAIAAGMSDGLGYGDNTKASLMTRGLAEISRLVVNMGGNPLTCMGLAGMGDLIATCTSRHSRNRKLGEMVAQGHTLEEFTEQTHMVAEGAVACVTVAQLAEKHGVDMPIANLVRGILYEGADLHGVVDTLMSRAAKDELA